MPIIRGTKNNKIGFYRYGESGKKYYYSKGNIQERNIAKKKAELQRKAIKVSQSKKILGAGLFKKIKDTYLRIKKNPFGLGYYRYCGPNTDLTIDDSPTNETDAICKKHDIQYDFITNKVKSGELTQEQIKQLVRKADNDMLNELSKLKKKSYLDKLVELAIKAKVKLEDYSLLKHSKFVGGLLHSLEII